MHIKVLRGIRVEKLSVNSRRRLLERLSELNRQLLSRSDADIYPSPDPIRGFSGRCEAAVVELDLENQPGS